MKNNLKNSFLNTLKSKSKSQNTIEAYGRNLNQFFRFLDQENKNVLDVKNMDIENFLLFLLNNGNSAATRSQKLATLKTFYNFLVATEQVDKNPCLYVEAPKLEKKLPVYLKAENVNSLLQEGKRKKKSHQDNRQRNDVIIRLLVNCGLRVSELVNIKLEDIDMLNNIIIIMGKGSKERIVGFNDETKKAIQEYIAKDRKKVAKSDYLIVNCRSGEQIGTRSIQKLIKELSADCLDPALAKKVSPHKLRHTCATLLFEKGVNLFTLQMVLGHSNLNTTKIYTHVANEAILAATQNFTV